MGFGCSLDEYDAKGRLSVRLAADCLLR